MHTSQKRLRQQQKHLAHHAQKNNAYTFFNILNAAHGVNDPDVLLMLIAQQRVGNRPGRIEPRNMKGMPKTYPLLMSPRIEARALVKKNGHPKKLK